MPIRRFLQNAATEFDPFHIDAMNLAFQGACHELRLVDADHHDPLLAIVAETVINIAQHGERDPARLQTLVIAAIRR